LRTLIVGGTQIFIARFSNQQQKVLIIKMARGYLEVPYIYHINKNTSAIIDRLIEKNIAFGVPDDLIDHEKVSKVINVAQLTEVVDTLPNGLSTLVGERGILLSGGQRQRVGIARAIYHDRQILVLDEAMAALDNETEKLVTDSTASLSLSNKLTLIVIAHRLTTIKDCDKIYMLNDGKTLKSGKYKEVVDSLSS
jgi:ATP-binding cassette, subfamily B, bacterial PglK